MKHLISIIESAAPSAAMHIRRQAYGRAGVRDFLIDVMSLANASVEGPRHIVVGVETDAAGRRQINGVAEEDFSGKPAYQRLVKECIEPPVRIRYHRIPKGNKLVGVFEIADSQDQPYMMRVDQSETLRRGDAYQRVNDRAVKMGRSKLKALFEANFADAVSASHIEVGFPGDIIFKDLKIPTHSFESLPSRLAAARQREMLAFKQQQHQDGVQTGLARLNYARLFGSDAAYVDHSTQTLIGQLDEVVQDFAEDDARFLFHDNAHLLQIVAYNQSEEELRNPVFTVVLPNHRALKIADELPMIERDGRLIKYPPEQRAMYPEVRRSRNAVKVTARMNGLLPGEMSEVFQVPLRICAGDELAGRKLGLVYSLSSSNLRETAKGSLTLRLQKAA